MKHLLFIKNTGALVEINRLATTSGDYGQIYDAMKQQAGTRDPYAFASIVELDPQQQRAGVYWDWELAGPGGASYRIHILPGVPDSSVDECETHIRRSYDCLILIKNRITRLIDFDMPQLRHEEINMRGDE